MSTLYSNCRSCHGCGNIESRRSEWQAYFWDHDFGDGVMPEPEGCGPKLFDCGECEGKGIKLTAAGEELAELFRRLGMKFTPPRSRQLLNINTWYVSNARAVAQ